jgi:hypothetical protein
VTSDPFLQRVLSHLEMPRGSSKFRYRGWRHEGRVTSEAVAVMTGFKRPIDVDSLATRILDFDHYVGNIDHVVVSRSLPVEGDVSRLYQRIHLPLLADLQLVNRVVDHGDIDGWRTLVWHLDTDRTDALDPAVGARFDYNDGVWLIREDAVAYGFTGAPRKLDVGRIRYALMTKGADATAPAVTRSTLKGMISWAERTTKP